MEKLYRNSWGFEGTHDEVVTNTLTMMEDRDLREYLEYHLTFSDLLDWIFKNHYNDFAIEFAEQIVSAQTEFINDYMEESEN